MAAAAAHPEEGYTDNYDTFRDDFYGTKAPSPNALRGSIRRFLQNTGMKVGEFQRIIGISAPPYGRFMNGKYKDQWRATENQTYSAAAYFFFREKKLGKKSVAKRMAATAPTKPPVPDLGAVELDDYTIFLTPIEVRKGLQQVQKDFACNDTQLARVVGAPNANAVSRFLCAGGEFGGQEQDMYRLGATFLEKLRVHLNKPKSKKRRAIEADTPAGKRPFLGVDSTQKFWAHKDDVLVKKKDALGRTIVASQSATPFGW
jgi:hypothetical protein